MAKLGRNKLIYIADNLFSSRRNKIMKIRPEKLKALNLFPKFHSLLENKKINCITHMKDFDGIGSASIVESNYRKNINAMFFTDYRKQEIADLVEKTKMLNNSAIIISDIGINKDSLSGILSMLRNFKRNNNIVIWLDHHEWDIGSVRKIAKTLDFLVCNENEINCATNIVYTLLGKKTKKAEKLVHMVMLGDLHKQAKGITEKIIQKMGYVISQICFQKNTAENLRELVGYVSDYKLENGFINKLYENYLKDAKMNTILLRKNMAEFIVKNKKFAVSFSKNLQSSFAGYFLLDHTGADVSIFYNSSTSTFHLRGRNTECASFAKYFHGGGHPFAAAFEYQKINITKKVERENAIKALENAAKKIY
ncbi:MAG: DHH family phosphoesterase [Candidatus Marsarchaeota archaeon]|nr:DHH family phosphoesterase [Candidatus Marsarchaeota archaeon]